MRWPLAASCDETLNPVRAHSAPVVVTGTINSSLLSPLRAPCSAPPFGAPALIVGAISSPVFRLGGESPHKPSRSRSTGGRLAQSPKSARANIRLRLCANPNHCASSTDHSRSPAGPKATPVFCQPLFGTSNRVPSISLTTVAKSCPPPAGEYSGDVFKDKPSKPAVFSSDPNNSVCFVKEPASGDFSVMFESFSFARL